MTLSLRHCLGMLVFGLSAMAGTSSPAQHMVHQQTPFNSVNNSFFERIGTSWSISHPGGAHSGPFSLNVGTFQNATPPFGSFAPGAGATGGVGVHTGGGWNLNFFGEASQGSRSSIVNQTPSVTTMNGATGFMADQAQSPFVISVIPVVGNAGGPFEDFGASNTVRGRLMRGEITFGQGGTQAPLAPATIRPVGENGLPRDAAGGDNAIPLRREQEARPPVKMNRDPLVLKSDANKANAPAAGGGARPSGPSSAEVGVASIEEIRKKQAAEREAEAITQRSEAEASFARGQAAENEGRLGAAKIHYQMALRRAAAMKDDGAGLQAKIEARLGAMK